MNKHRPKRRIVKQVQEHITETLTKHVKAQSTH